MEKSLYFRSGDHQCQEWHFQGHGVEVPRRRDGSGFVTTHNRILRDWGRTGHIELRHGSVARKDRYNEASKWAIVGSLNTDKKAAPSLTAEATTVTYGPDNGYKAVIKHAPFAIDFWRDEEIQVKFNGKGFLNMEHWRPKIDKPAVPEREIEEGEDTAPEAEAAPTDARDDESTWWEESFGGNTDSKPKGPESVGLDITFPGYEHVYGIPQHTGPLSLKETRYGQRTSA